MLVQRSFRQPWVDVDQWQILDIQIERAFRLLRLYFELTTCGDDGVTPVLRHVGPSGQTIGMWMASNPASGLGSGNPTDTGKICMSTSPPAPTFERVQVPGGVYIHVPLPPDLIVQKNERLEIKLHFAEIATEGGTNTVVGSEIFFTVVLEP